MNKEQLNNQLKKVNKIDLIQKIALTVFIITVLVTSFTILGFYFFEKPKMYYKNLPFPVQPHVLKPGQAVPSYVERCNTDDGLTTYTITRVLQSMDGGESIVLPPIQVILEPGCKASKSLVSVIPYGTKPGTYRMIGKATLDGTVRKFVVDWYTQPFEVVCETS